MEVQQAMGSDIAMVFDECTPAGSDAAYLDQSLARTIRWAKRSKEAFEKGRAASNNIGAHLFGIVQGGVDVSRRIAHAEALKEIGFGGYAIGGLSVGESFDQSCEVVDALNDVLPKDRPRYFMGGAQPHEIVEYVRRGVDMMDCVLPTRNARHGLLYRFTHGDVTKPDFYETVHVTNERFRLDMTPLVPKADDPISAELSRYSFAYIRHLFTVDEMLAFRLMTLANVQFYLELMKRIRVSIDEGIF
jgi:queuine tRNA-ribosyltransferase